MSSKSDKVKVWSLTHKITQRGELLMAGKLSKEERKALIEKAEEDRAKHPQKKTKSGFAVLDEEAEKLEKSN